MSKWFALKALIATAFESMFSFTLWELKSLGEETSLAGCCCNNLYEIKRLSSSTWFLLYTLTGPSFEFRSPPL